MITVNLFTSGRHTKPLIKALKRAINVKLANIYSKLPYPPDSPDKTDIFVVAGFGQIVPKKVLEIPKYGSLCIHPSLLPKYRGASPVQFAILNGEKETGITIFKMDEKIDHGPIIAQFKEKIRPDDTSGSLYQRLFAAGAEVLITILPAYIEGRIKPREQDHQKATYTRILTRDNGYIPSEVLRAAIKGKKLQSYKVTKLQSKKNKNSATLPLCHPATFLDRFIRAFNPWPGAWTKIKVKSQKSSLDRLGMTLSEVEGSKVKSKRLKIIKAHLEFPQIPNTKYQILIFDEVQLEGKKPVSWKQFTEGYPEAKLCK